jgi:hypothetical protein
MSLKTVTLIDSDVKIADVAYSALWGGGGDSLYALKCICFWEDEHVYYTD